MTSHKKRSSYRFKKWHHEKKITPVDWTGKSHSSETIIKMKNSHIGKHTGEKKFSIWENLDSQY